MKAIPKNREQIVPSRLLADWESAGIDEPFKWGPDRRESTKETMPLEEHRL
jgi:hypothetical protein